MYLTLYIYIYNDYITNFSQVTNTLSVNVSVYYMTARGNEVRLLGEVKPGGILRLPLQAVHTPTAEIFFSVEGTHMVGLKTGRKLFFILLSDKGRQSKFFLFFEQIFLFIFFFRFGISKYITPNFHPSLTLPIFNRSFYYKSANVI